MEREDEQRLIAAIALRVGTGQQIADLFGITLPGLKAYVEKNRERIQRAQDRILGRTQEVEAPAPSQPTPGQLDDLWITNKYERLKRMQNAAEEMQAMMESGALAPAELATAVRELRSYMMLAANELGQLLHRGAGEQANGDVLSVEISGVDMETLR